MFWKLWSSLYFYSICTCCVHPGVLWGVFVRRCVWVMLCCWLGGLMSALQTRLQSAERSRKHTWKHSLLYVRTPTLKHCRQTNLRQLRTQVSQALTSERRLVCCFLQWALKESQEMLLPLTGVKITMVNPCHRSNRGHSTTVGAGKGWRAGCSCLLPVFVDNEGWARLQRGQCCR